MPCSKWFVFTTTSSHASTWTDLQLLQNFDWYMYKPDYPGSSLTMGIIRSRKAILLSTAYTLLGGHHTQLQLRTIPGSNAFFRNHIDYISSPLSQPPLNNQNDLTSKQEQLAINGNHQYLYNPNPPTIRLPIYTQAPQESNSLDK